MNAREHEVWEAEQRLVTSADGERRTLAGRLALEERGVELLTAEEVAELRAEIDPEASGIYLSPKLFARVVATLKSLTAERDSWKAQAKGHVSAVTKAERERNRLQTEVDVLRAKLCHLNLVATEQDAIIKRGR